ncbi:MAG: methyltransferase domain-containing protein [Promethearchaeota archaeon]
MKRTGVTKKFNEFIALTVKENKISLINLKLILKSFYFSFKSFIKQERNIASEVYSYESLFFIKKKDPIAFLESCRRNPAAFAPGIRDVVFDLKKQFNVDVLETLEIGSGPNSNLSYWVDNKLIRVIAIDPLAHIYRKMMKRLNYIYPIVPIKLKGENLLKSFKKESFHIIYAQNSLDHAENPLKCFRNGYHLLKKGGLFFVCTNIREGSRKSWTGMHKYDIYIENKELFLENQKGEVFKFIDNKDIIMEFIFYEEYRKWGVPSFEAVFKKI